jgi:hypothetical protein
MDPKMFEINNLRVLNDYLNQTIDVLLRTQRFGATSFTPGISHSPYGIGMNNIGALGTIGNGAIDPTYYTAGISHSPYTSTFGGVSPFTTGAFGATVNPAVAGYANVVDPFLAQRGLGHSPLSNLGAWQPWSPVVEMARQQHLTQALAARQSVLEAVCRAAGIPV